MEIEVNNTKIANLVLILGIILIIAAFIFGPPASFAVFPAGGIMAIVGSRMRKRIEPLHPLPLSQKSAKNKIVAGLPAILLIILSLFLPSYKPLVGGLGLFLLAYSFVGLVELFIDRKFPDLKNTWENLQGWKSSQYLRSLSC